MIPIHRIWNKMCMIRAFEDQVYKAVEDGRIGVHVYLAAGQEAAPAAISEAIDNPYVLAQHRAHGIYLSHGGDLTALRDELLGLPTGCCKGMGGSPPIQDRSAGIIGHSGLIGEHVPIATGMAFASGRPVVCYFGDGAAEEDYVTPMFGFAKKHNVPILFVCEDNNLSVLTPKEDRRDWDLCEVAEGYGIEAYDLADDPIDIYETVIDREEKLPALLNIHVCRRYWHVGAGQDEYAPKWDRMQMTHDMIKNLPRHMSSVDPTIYKNAAEKTMEELWK